MVKRISSELLRAIISCWAEPRILLNTHSGVNPWKQPTALWYWLFPQKKHHCRRWTGFQMYLKLEQRCKCSVQVDCKWMEFVATGWRTGKWLRVDRTLRDVICGELEIPFVVIRLGLTYQKGMSSYTSWNCLVRGGEEVVWFSVCGAPLGDWTNVSYVDVLATSVVCLCMVSIVLVLWGVILVLF